LLHIFAIAKTSRIFNFIDIVTRTNQSWNDLNQLIKISDLNHKFD